jgi:Papain family cysteine protease
MSVFPAFMTRRAFVTGLGAVSFPSRILCQPAQQLVRHARGAKVPVDLPGRIRAHNRLSSARDKILRADADFMKALWATNPRVLSPQENLPSRFDWRDSDHVTEVRDQGLCLSCWVFAATAAYESACLLSNGKTYTQLPLHVSEQEGLDCSFAESDCVNGGWHEIVLVYLLVYGEVDNATYNHHPTPDYPTKGRCVTSYRNRPYRIANWGYVEPAGSSVIPTVDAMKRAIHTQGPMVSAVLAYESGPHDWDLYDKSRTLDWDKKYPNDVYEGVTTPKDFDPMIANHEVLIVGWDDSRGAWIIKNSWSGGWGVQGYIYLRYGSNLIGLGATWVLSFPPKAGRTVLRKLENAKHKEDLLKLYPGLKALR